MAEITAKSTPTKTSGATPSRGGTGASPGTPVLAGSPDARDMDWGLVEEETASFTAPREEEPSRGGGGRATGESEGGEGDEARRTTAKPKEVDVVRSTSGKDKYVVRVDGVQKVLGKDEIERLGGTVPVSIERENILHDIGVREGSKARQAQETLFRRTDAATKLSGEQGISFDEAMRLITAAETNPVNEELVTASPEAATAIIGASRISPDQMGDLARARGAHFKSENVQVGIQTRGEPQYISKSDFQALQKTDPRGAEILKREGFAGYEGRLRDVQREQAAKQTAQERWLETAIVVGASPTTNEVLVKGADGKEQWIKTDKRGVADALSYISDTEKRYDAEQSLKQAGVINDDGMLDVVAAVQQRIPLSRMRQAGYNVPQSQIDEAKAILNRPSELTGLKYVSMSPIAPEGAKGPQAIDKWLDLRTNRTMTDAERLQALKQNPNAPIVRNPESVKKAVLGRLTEVATATAEFPAVAMPFLRTGEQQMVSLGSSPMSKLPLSAIGGAGLAIMSIPVGLIGLAGEIALSPKETPQVLWRTGKGLVNQVATTFNNFATGAYASSTASGDFTKPIVDGVASYLILSAPAKAVKSVASTVFTYASPKGLPFSSIGREPSTGRIPTPDAFAKSYAEAMNKVERLAMTKGGARVGVVPIEGTAMQLRYVKTPLQQQIGDVLFHGTKTEVGKPSLLDIAARTGEVKAGGAGIYTDPWAAIGYTRGGANPGLMIILTDATKVKSGSSGLAEGLTQSDKFVRGASEGFYGSSKAWRGDLETEIVGAPGTKISVPTPTAGLLTRMVTGKYSDFFTYDSGKFVPIKIALDRAFKPATMDALKSAPNMYAVKLAALVNTLQDMGLALRRPGAVLKDISGTLKEMVNIQRWLREGIGSKGGLTFPGIRDVYLETSWGVKIGEVARNLFDKAFRQAKQKVGSGVKKDSAAFRRVLDSSLEEVYRSNADAILRAFVDVARAYGSNSEFRDKFEQSYLTNLGVSLDALTKSVTRTTSLAENIASDLSRIHSRPIITEMVASYLSANPSSGVSSGVITDTVLRSIASGASSLDDIVSSPISSPVSTTRTPRTPTSRRVSGTPTSSVRSLRTTRTPRTPRTPTTSTTTTTTLVEAIITGKRAKLPEGSIAWKQGFLYRWVPYEDWVRGAAKPRALPRGVTPIGATRIGKTPADTIQMIGDLGASVPDIDVDLGVTDIFIRDQAQTITFGGSGLKTDVGKGVDSPAKGMTVGGSGAPAKGHAYARKTYPQHSVSRTAISAGEAETSVRGINRPAMMKEAPKRSSWDITQQKSGLAEELEETTFPDETAPDKSVSTEDRGNEIEYFDEDPNWLREPVNRTKMRKKRPLRKAENQTTIRSLRL